MGGQVKQIRRGELTLIAVAHADFTAEVCLQGAQLLHFAPRGQANWLWLSEQASFSAGQSVRGGIPLCWPWFGVPEKNPAPVRDLIASAQAHGFARTALWTLEQTHITESAVQLAFSLLAEPDGHWRGYARASVVMDFSARGCQLHLSTENLGDQPLALTQALHTYLPVPAIEQARVEGLQGCDYIDTLRDWQRFTQQGALQFGAETDRIYYLDPAQGLRLSAGGQAGRRLQGSGSGSVVVWNPWQDKARRLSDFAPDAWQRMLCIETANALDDARLLAPGARTTLGLTLSA